MIEEKLFNASLLVGIIKLNNNLIVDLDDNAKKILDQRDEILYKEIEEIIPNYNFRNIADNIIVENLVIKDDIVYLVNVATNESKGERVLVLISGRNVNEFKALLEFFVEYLHDDLMVADGKGNVLRVSRSWEEKHDVRAEDIIDKNVIELEKLGVFRPSVTKAVLEKKRRVEMLQYNKKREKILVSGVPIFNNSDEIQWVISYSSWDISNFKELKAKNEELENLMERYSAEIEELRRENMKIPGIISESPQMNSIIGLIKKIAPLDINILITGETGVGKNLIARTIHQFSKRCEEAFIEINCGAIPENLIESELFGYEKGAFTGARESGKVGLIELANNGTLFLDEIGELPLNLQVKLLKTLQDKEIVRIGGTQSIYVDFRLITATNRDIKKLVEEKKFRADLYFRISVVPITIPSLRERREDLKELIEHLFIKSNEKYNVKKILSKEAMGTLLSYDWPGNVRELENVIEQIVVTTTGDYILPIHLPDNILLSANLGKEQGISLVEAMENYESCLITRAYEKYRTTVGVSQALGISQSTAVRKIKKYVKEVKTE